MARILLIEDEPSLITALKDILHEEGHRVLAVSDGETGLEWILERKPDLVLLDIMLPRIDGLTVCQAARKHGVQVPVLMLTAKGQVDDRVRGLDSGADDYLVKPFSTRELLARIRALLRRAETEEKAALHFLQLGDVEIDFVRMEARKKDKALELGAREFAMLRLLAENAGKPVSRDDFLDRVWQYQLFPTTRTVDNHIVKIRAKIEPDPRQPRWIHTVHGVGYRLDASARLNGAEEK
ncbi:MAG: response regulator transcription factor [Verrucomicrobiae bacterium]|nr:response regulator transcription factor [Verrucomicrobiae bacterium]